MKKILLALFSAILSVLSATGQLNALHNHYRSGDVLIKQQVEFIDPGPSGTNLLWNFSKLKTIEEEYTLKYTDPPLEGDSVYILGDLRYGKGEISENELIVGTEHNTMYYYQTKGGSLFQTGHENPVVKLEYTSPVLLIPFPLDYGQEVTSDYSSKGSYSGTIDIQTKGQIITSADAYGELILPSGDTLGQVLRVKTLQLIEDVPDPDSYEIDEESNKGKLLETYRWYSKGYRYPVFETVRNINLPDSAILFSTAFFYPPQDHFYLDTDSENLALLDELWKKTENIQTHSKSNDREGKNISLKDIMYCEIYPNPVVTQVNLEYELKKDAEVVFELYSIAGSLVKKIQSNKAKGFYSESIDCSRLYPGNYILHISADNHFFTEIIIKK